MRTRPIHLGLAGLVVTLSLVLVGHSGAPAPQADQVMQGEIKYLEAELKKATLTIKGQRKARMAAIMLAAAAKASGDKKHEHVVNKALQIAKLLGDKNHDDAKKILASIIDGKGDPGKPMAYKEALDLELTMRIFSSEKIGGFGMEVWLEDLVMRKDPIKPDEYPMVAAAAAKIALIGEVALHHPPEKEKGDKTKKAWDAFAKDMNKAARELADGAAKKMKTDDVIKLADKLSHTCSECHDVFRGLPGAGGGGAAGARANPAIR